MWHNLSINSIIKAALNPNIANKNNQGVSQLNKVIDSSQIFSNDQKASLPA